jgi:hypothetical protein
VTFGKQRKSKDVQNTGHASRAASLAALPVFRFPDGTLEIARSKTGRLAFVAVPREVLDSVRPYRDGRCWPLLTSREWFRRTFAKIVKRAGLFGTFPKLRKSSGTYAELLNPGRGHEHLANSRKIFETHYLSRRHIPKSPLSPPPLFWPGKTG